MSNIEDDEMNAAGFIISAFAYPVVLIFMGFILKIMWNWNAVGVLSENSISHPQAIGLLIIAKMLIGPKTIIDSDSGIYEIMLKVIHPLIAIAISWFVSTM